MDRSLPDPVDHEILDEVRRTLDSLRKARGRRPRLTRRRRRRTCLTRLPARRVAETIPKVVISALCLALVVAHMVWPNITVDATTAILVTLAILPWLGGVIHSMEGPGGWKIVLQDVRSALDKVTTGASAKKTPQATGGALTETLVDVASSDPSLTIVGLRIEIERRLSRLAKDSGLPAGLPVAVVLRALIGRRLVDRKTAAGLSDLVALGNMAAHGAEVSPDAAAWVAISQHQALELLDSMIAGRVSESDSVS